MKISTSFYLLSLLCVDAFSGNLARLIALGENATYENVIKPSKAPNFNNQKAGININLSGRYVISPDQNGEYKTKTGSLTARLEYLLYDGGVDYANYRANMHKNISKLYKNDEILNQTAFEIGQIYFNAVAIDEMVKLINELTKILAPILDEASFWVEFGDISSDEFGVLNSSFHELIKQADELEFRRFELLTRINLLANGEIDFLAGSRFTRPNFSVINSAKNQSNMQLGLAKSYSNANEQGKLMPKLYIKDTQSFNTNSFKFDGKSSKDVLSGYLDANRPMLEFSWNLPNKSSSKERQIRRLEEHKSTQVINSDIALNSELLDSIRQKFLSLEAKTSIDEIRQKRLKNELLEAILKYRNGEIDTEKMALLIDEFFQNSMSFILNVSELEILKMQWYFQSGERLADKVL